MLPPPVESYIARFLPTILNEAMNCDNKKSQYTVTPSKPTA